MALANWAATCLAGPHHSWCEQTPYQHLPSAHHTTHCHPVHWPPPAWPPIPRPRTHRQAAIHPYRLRQQHQSGAPAPQRQLCRQRQHLARHCMQQRARRRPARRHHPQLPAGCAWGVECEPLAPGVGATSAAAPARVLAHRFPQPLHQPKAQQGCQQVLCAGGGESGRVGSWEGEQ